MDGEDEVGRILGHGGGVDTPVVHSLPCSILHNGPANVSAFFCCKNTGASADGMEVKEAAFRGRKLMGSTLQLPGEYRGFVLEKESSKVGDDVDEWGVRSGFSEITYWNHDTMPSSSDPLPRCIDWLSISAAIHKPVIADQVSSVLPIKEEVSCKRKSEV